MPLHKPKGRGRKAVRRAVSRNMHELAKANRSKPASKRRSLKQRIAISLHAAGVGKKRKKK